jgi:predicted chitinase
VMDDPDLVASEYAVHSAVFFWDRNGLNTFADKDDVVALTRKINGGENGLAHRRELLNKANGLLAMLDLGAAASATATATATA